MTDPSPASRAERHGSAVCIAAAKDSRDTGTAGNGDSKRTKPATADHTSVHVSLMSSRDAGSADNPTCAAR